MIIRNNKINLFFTLLFLLIFPFVQKQWFNLYSFNNNDISYSTNIVREMVTKYGFSIIGPISMDSDSNQMFLGDGLFRRKSLLAENTSSKIDNEIMKISKISLNNSIEILKKNRVLLDKLVDILLNLETIDKKVFKLTTSKLLKV